MRVARFDTFDGRSFYLDDPNDHKVREFWRRFFEEPGMREKAEAAHKNGIMNKTTILDMSEAEYNALPATSDSHKYLSDL